MAPTHCECGLPPKIRCSWTDANPGRRFYGCEKYGNVGSCGLFVWFDPPMCERSRHVIPGLLRSLDRLEGEVHRLEAQLQIVQAQLHTVRNRENRLRRVLVVVGLLFLVWLVGFGESNVEDPSSVEMKQLL